jgi:hypothetical protein
MGRRHPERFLTAQSQIGRQALADETATDQARHPELVLDDQDAHESILPHEHELKMTV